MWNNKNWNVDSLYKRFQNWNVAIKIQIRFHLKFSSHRKTFIASQSLISNMTSKQVDRKFVKKMNSSASSSVKIARKKVVKIVKQVNSSSSSSSIKIARKTIAQKASRKTTQQTTRKKLLKKNARKTLKTKDDKWRFENEWFLFKLNRIYNITFLIR